MEEMECYRFASSHLATEFFDTCYCSFGGSALNVNGGMDTLSKMFSGKGNVPLVSQIEDTIHDLTQGDKTVTTYVGELNRAWADLDHLAPLLLLILNVWQQ